MTFSDLLTRIKTTWHSRPLSLIIPIVALVVFWATHGHTLTRAAFPTFGEWVAGSLLWTASFEKVADFLLPKTPPAGPVALVLLVVLGLGGCKTTQTPGPTTPVGTFGHCSSDALRTAAESILGRVTTALSTGNYVDQIAALATEVGAAEVGCAVDLVIAEFTTKASRSDDAQVGVVLAHAQAWRGANP